MYCSIFIILGTIALIWIVSGYCAVAFLIGGATSMLCGYIGMAIATYANYRTAYQAMD